MTNPTPKPKQHWKKLHNYNYLGSYSLTEGRDMVLTIRELKSEEIAGSSGKKERGFICHFVENVKPMVLNKTNCKIIEKLYDTPFIEDWIGKKIQIYSERVDAFGTTTDALRIRKQIPGGKSEKQILADLYESKKSLMKVSDQRNAERIIRENETENFEKLKRELAGITAQPVSVAQEVANKQAVVNRQAPTTNTTKP